jgi:hypothetical protein
LHEASKAFFVDNDGAAILGAVVATTIEMLADALG